MMQAKRASLAFATLLLTLVSACKSTPTPEWVEADVPPVSLRVLWEVTRQALMRESFPVAAPGFDPRTRTVTSGWRMDLHPFHGEGYRERATVRYEPGPGGRIDLAVRVEHEINNNVARPLDPSHADWKKSADEPGRAAVLLQSIRSLLGDSRGLQRE